MAARDGHVLGYRLRSGNLLPNWFWERWKNSHILQVQPTALMLKDEAILAAAEALPAQTARDLFFGELRALLAAELRKYALS